MEISKWILDLSWTVHAFCADCSCQMLSFRNRDKCEFFFIAQHLIESFRECNQRMGMSWKYFLWCFMWLLRAAAVKNYTRWTEFMVQHKTNSIEFINLPHLWHGHFCYCFFYLLLAQFSETCFDYTQIQTQLKYININVIFAAIGSKPLFHFISDIKLLFIFSYVCVWFFFQCFACAHIKNWLEFNLSNWLNHIKTTATKRLPNKARKRCGVRERGKTRFGCSVQLHPIKRKVDEKKRQKLGKS